MKNKINTLLFIMMFSVTSLLAQSSANDRNSIINTAFPEVKAKTLLNNQITFPAVVKNKIAIICIAFNDDGRPVADTWVKEIPGKYKDSDIVFYEMPMIKNAPKLFRGVIEKGMRKGTDVKLHDNVANYYGKIDAYKKALLMNDEKTCYTFLLDKNGLIQYSVVGKTTKENLQELDAKIKELSK
jgi:ATP10 protein